MTMRGKERSTPLSAVELPGTSVLGRAEPRVLYVINNFNRGGAELGLIHLVRHGAFFGCKLKVVSVVRGSGEPLEELARLGVEIGCLSQQRQMRTLDWLLSFPKLLIELVRVRPDFIVLSLPQANISGRIAVAFAKLLTKRPIVISFEHNTHLSKPIFERLYRITSGIVNWLVADCEATAAEAQARLYRSTPERVIILPLVSFSPIAGTELRQSGPRHPFTLLSAARLTPVKNQESIIRAIHILKSSGAEVRLKLFGEGKCRQSYVDLVQALSLHEQVQLLGYSDRWAEHPADAFIVASLHEGLCISALEAMSRGLPVIATRVGGLTDYGDAAQVMFVNSSNPEELASAIVSLMNNPGLRTSMVAAGHQMISSRFSETKIRRTYSAFSMTLRAIQAPAC